MCEDCSEGASGKIVEGVKGLGSDNMGINTAPLIGGDSMIRGPSLMSNVGIT